MGDVVLFIMTAVPAYYAVEEECGSEGTGSSSCQAGAQTELNIIELSCINHNAAVPSSTPTSKIFTRLTGPTSTMVSNGESWYARDKVIGKSSVSNVEKASCGKRVLDVECKNGFRFGFKEDKVIHANDFASTSTASLVKPESAQVYKKTKKQTDIWNRVIPTATRFNEVQRTVGMIKLGQEGLVMSLVDSEGKRACPVCKKKCASIKTLYQHMDLDSDRKWHTRFTSLITHNINESSENNNHEAALVDLTKSFADWDVKTGKRGRFGSRVADVKVNKASYTKYYSGFTSDDHVEMNAEDIQAAKTLVLMANDYLSDTKNSMTAQKEAEAAKGLSFLVDHVDLAMGGTCPLGPPFVSAHVLVDHVDLAMVESKLRVEEFSATNVTERQIHVEDSADTSNGGIKMVLAFDLNEPPALEDDSSAKMA
ncbi:hypothetical protein Tco_0648197 [Tanacetum coccineum]